MAVAGLIAAAAAFMEMNFLVAEGPVVIAGFAAAYFVVRYAESGRRWHAAVAGLTLGIAFQFKQSAAFYSVGMACWMIAACRPSRRGLAGAGWLSLGHLLPIGAAAVYFAVTNRWMEHVEWTYQLRSLDFQQYRISRPTVRKLIWFTGLTAATAIAAVSIRRLPGDQSSVLTAIE